MNNDKNRHYRFKKLNT
jgi:hypothetical protein